MPFPATFGDFNKGTKKWFYDTKKGKWGGKQNHSITVQSKTEQGFKLKSTLGYPGSEAGVNVTEATFGLQGVFHKVLDNITFKLSPDFAANKQGDIGCTFGLNVPNMDTVKFSSTQGKGGIVTHKLESIYRHESLAAVTVDVECNENKEASFNVGASAGDKNLGLTGGASLKVENKKFGESKEASTQLTQAGAGFQYNWNDKILTTVMYNWKSGSKQGLDNLSVTGKATLTKGIGLAANYSKGLFEVAGDFALDGSTNVMIHGDTQGRLHSKLSAKFADSDLGMNIFSGYQYKKSEGLGNAFKATGYGVAFTLGSQ